MIEKPIDQDLFAQNLAIEARQSIGEYCFSECHAYCCRKGYIVLSVDEADLLTNNSKEGLNMVNDKEYVLDLSRDSMGCPSLKENKCVVHTNPGRPVACREFPLFLWRDKTVKLSKRCPAVREELLYPYLAKFKRMGYSLVYGDEVRTRISLIDEKEIECIND